MSLSHLPTDSGERWLILSHAFNMDGRAASQTITDKLPHLRSLGVEPVIVSSVLGDQDEVFEHHQVWPIGGAGLRFDLRHVIRRYLGTGLIYKLCVLLLTIFLSPLILFEKILFGLDSQASWAVSAYLYSLYLIKKRGIKVVYSTGGAYSAHLAGYWLKRTLGVRWIAEIHDPMVSPEGGIRTTSDRRTKFLAVLEARICSDADVAWWFTEGALKSAQARHPNAQAKMLCLLPGAEPPEVPAAYQGCHVYGEICIFAHFGTLTDTRSLKHFLMAFALWQGQYPKSAAQCEIHIYGSALDQASQRYIASQNLSKFIRCHGRLEFSSELGLTGRQQVSIRMRQADCLLLTHGDTAECAEYIPSKFYEYLWARRPQLAMVQQNPQLVRLAAEQGFYVAPATDVNAITLEIDKVFSDWQERRLGVRRTITPIGVKACTTQIVELVKQ
ncbi:MAG: hypothetical protein QM533_05960 [Cytophagales bacterium]|nr:hypothetical protein [Cytophagales bacterium]